MLEDIMTKVSRIDVCIGRVTSGLIRPWKLFKWEHLLRRMHAAIEVKYLFRFAITFSLLILLIVCYYSMICPLSTNATPTHASTENLIALSVRSIKATPNPFRP